MLVVQDYAQEATVDRQPAAAGVIDKARFPEVPPEEMGLDARILSIAVFRAGLTRPRGFAAEEPFLEARVHHHTCPAG